MNDWLLKINDVDLTNKDRKQAVKAVLSGSAGPINMVVRRRKSLGGRMVTPVHVSLTGHKGTEKHHPVSLAGQQHTRQDKMLHH